MNVLEQLTKQANTMLRSVGYKHNVNVNWLDQQNTAFMTMGTQQGQQVREIYLSREFYGIDLTVPKSFRIASGLIVHEITHFLQPLEEIDEVQNATGLNDGFVNMLCDVSGERMADKLFPQAAKNLAAVRNLVGKSNIPLAKESLQPDRTFVDHCRGIVLLGRFHPDKTAYSAHAHKQLRKLQSRIHRLQNRQYKTAKAQRNREYKLGDLYRKARVPVLDSLYDTVTYSPDDITRAIKAVASGYPELCEEGQPAVPSYLDGVTANNLPTSEVIMARQEVSEILSIVYSDTAPLPPTMEAMQLAQRLKLKLVIEKVTNRIVAPHKINRRQIASTANPLPYYMDIEVGKHKARNITLVLDISYSMTSAGVMDSAFLAAQGIALAVQSAGGRVTGALFSKECLLSEHGGSAWFFNPDKALGTIARDQTMFTFLAKLWKLTPKSLVIVITDEGEPHGLPAVVSERDKERTHIISLCPAHPALYEIATVHDCPDIAQLPDVMIEIVK